MAILNLVLTGVNLEDIFRGLDQFEAGLDMHGLAEDIGLIVYEDNAEARLSGVDMDGATMAPLAPSTIKTRSGDGPPLVPDFGGSRAIQDFTIRITDIDADAIAITGSWPDTPFIQFHQSGYTSLGGNPVPARPIVGVRPVAGARIADQFEAWAASKIVGN